MRTPTATVTDLGTEFGVEVDGRGVTETCVFLGKVRVSGRGATPDADSSGSAGSWSKVLPAGQAMRIAHDTARAVAADESAPRFVRQIVSTKADSPALIGDLDYSETWTCNSPTRAGSHLDLVDSLALEVENHHGSPQRLWTISALSAATTWPYLSMPGNWPGFRVEGSKSGMLECGLGDCYLGFEYGLRDDFIVQFDAVQATNRINITIGDKPANMMAEGSLSVFFRPPGTLMPEIGVYTPSKLEADGWLRSSIPRAFEWHNYAVRFNLPKKQLGVWVDRRYRGAIDLSDIRVGMPKGESWASLPWGNRYVTVGCCTEGRVWSDNFRVGSPAELALPKAAAALPMVSNEQNGEGSRSNPVQPSPSHKEK